MPVTRPRDKSSRWEPAHAHRRMGPLMTAALAVCVSTMTACAGAPPIASETPGPGPTSTQPQPAPAGLGQARAAEQTRKIMEAVAKARALPVTGEVEVAVMHRAEIRDYAKVAMYEHNTREQIRMFTRI